MRERDRENTSLDWKIYNGGTKNKRLVAQALPINISIYCRYLTGIELANCSRDVFFPKLRILIDKFFFTLVT